jgi:hypothetical protein
VKETSKFQKIVGADRLEVKRRSREDFFFFLDEKEEKRSLEQRPPNNEHFILNFTTPINKNFNC